jgi:hypothetical protein
MGTNASTATERISLPSFLGGLKWLFYWLMQFITHYLELININYTPSLFSSSQGVKKRGSQIKYVGD